ncbi:ATP-binding cassette domain-containing protein [Tessaracoccus coleopterorum]|uniref:ATP-binding cassette domain-containing protein n=1 Tax=Tessaracoccus coleopterorum TaxID=2714950 RepID=UPI001E651A1D|nr:ATP-binding cassette domain-containing protein [Tessaracoccus coleopterorum]
MSAIAISGLVKDYGKFRALNGLDLELGGGQIVGLLGENGCGKTTLLKVIAGALTRYQGSVLVNGSTPGPETKAQVSFLPTPVSSPTAPASTPASACTATSSPTSRRTRPAT